jgi:predicted kinase
MSGKLYVMMGVSGAGKSSFANNHINKDTDVIVSRDAIRFSMIKENEEYFSKEKKVFKEYIHQINKNLANGFNVYADATHITKASRNKLLKNITEKPSETILIWIDTPLSECISQNELRAGTRSYVSESVIYSMNKKLEFPSVEEGFDKIYII